MHELPAGPARLWSAVLVAGAIALGVGGGAIDDFRPEPTGAVPEDTPLPVLEEPRGELPAPPAVFRWRPGGDDVDVAQVVVFRGNLEPFWQSGAVTGPPIEIVPEEVFEGIPAGENLLWRVREVADGRPRATSDLAQFSFATDIRGRPVGESVADPTPLREK